MRLIISAFLAAGSLWTLASQHPRYGGTLRMATSAGVAETYAGFRVAEQEPGKRVRFEAEAGVGRPFLDAIEVLLNKPAREQAIEFELGRLDVVEAPVIEARRKPNVHYTKLRDVIALEFDEAVAATRREAVALSIDRAAIHRVILQRQGEPSSALLPQWMSGWAFLFPMTRDVVRARGLAAGALGFAYDRQDTLLRSIGERIAVNASEAGIVLRPAPGKADLRLVWLRLRGESPTEALQSLGAAVTSSEYEAERQLTEKFVPIVHLPRAYQVSAKVRNWTSATELGDVWLDPR